MPNETDNSPIYPSHAASGLTTIAIPYMRPVTGEGLYSKSAMQPFGADQPDAVEKIRACDFGTHVSQQIESDFKYRGPIAASARLSHYCEHGKSTLLDTYTAGRMERMAAAMPRSADPEKYFRETVEPFLRSLTPKAR